MFSKNKLLIVSMMILGMTACKKDAEKNAASAASQIPTVDVVKLQPENIPLSFEFSARAQGAKETEVRARVGGILLHRNYVEGSKVEEGQVLFEIDPAEFIVSLNKAKATLAQAQAELVQTESQWKRIQKLHQQGYASGKDYDDAKARYESSKAAVQSAEAEVEARQLDLDYTKVTAPISGLTSMEVQSEGSLISATGDASLLTRITQLDPIYVIFSTTENELWSLTNMVERGLIKNPENKSEIKAKVKFSDDTTYKEEGEINFINPTIDKNTGTIKLRAVFPNPDTRIRPGQFVRLVMEGLTRINALVIPQEAVMQSSSGSFVYRVNDNGLVELVSVIPGLTTKDGGWIIDEGLKEGDMIVSGSIMKLRPGMKVNPKIEQDTAAQNAEVDE